ncbi:Crp/Fnr family transcriptional regulator [Mesorhizobium sp. YM1C-6-2]|uniref:Crp/Fnr family transcriptional regulator n=1 Tax=Mesorhizobium sp. YM1C-6-2 TaxID=1827501 RepID=UPI000EF27587|nr:Crp/Fnr family transcriptional regulator [Mesorhizobium sp. YM1C-6-2]RLP22604.1 Crp/Fnr family transcriptional regulator [Mesorhizobium sp. YM1C-6-2]
MVQTAAFLRSLERRDSLSDDEIRTISELPSRPAVFTAGEDIVVEGSRLKESCLVTSGFAARSQSLRSGERQITAVHVPGDFVDLHSMLLKVMDHSVVALGPCKVAFVPHEAIRVVTETSPHLARMFWLSTVIDGAIQRTWITCLGRRSAEQHLAHLICELYVRLEVAGAASDFIFEFPVTQAQLGDVLGLSVVHVNRKLQELRAAGLVEWRDGKVKIRDFERLAQMSEFDPTYLSLRRESR